MHGQGDHVQGLPTGRIAIPEGVVRRMFEGSMVLLNLESGQYHGLNEVAARMLDELGQTGDASATARRVAGEFDAPIDTVAADLVELLDQLAERGLIVIDAS